MRGSAPCPAASASACTSRSPSAAIPTRPSSTSPPSASSLKVHAPYYPEGADGRGSRIVVIDRGVVIADATPREIKARIPSKRITFSVATAVGEATFRGLPVQSLEGRDQRVG